MHDSRHFRQQAQQQHASCSTRLSCCAASCAKAWHTKMMVRITAIRSEPRAIEPRDVEHARSSGFMTAGRQAKHPREVVSSGEKYQPPTAPHLPAADQASRDEPKALHWLLVEEALHEHLAHAGWRATDRDRLARPRSQSAHTPCANQAPRFYKLKLR